MAIRNSKIGDMIEDFKSDVQSIYPKLELKERSSFKTEMCPISHNRARAISANRSSSGNKIYYSLDKGLVFNKRLGTNTDDLSEVELLHLSRKIWEANYKGIAPELEKIIGNIRQATRPNYLDHVDILLQYIDRSCEVSFYSVEIGTIEHTQNQGNHNEYEFHGDADVKSACFCQSDHELESLFKAAIRDGFVEQSINPDGDELFLRLTRAGHERIQGLEKISDHEQAFVAMWFHESMNRPYSEAIQQAVLDAGYQPYRIDIDNTSGDAISNEILAQIRRSRFIVADVTCGESGVRGGVYYEAGFAQGLGIPVFFTVREDQIDEVHFDTRQYPHTLWNPNELAQFQLKLKNAIEARIGRGPISS